MYIHRFAIAVFDLKQDKKSNDTMTCVFVWLCASVFALTCAPPTSVLRVSDQIIVN